MSLQERAESFSAGDGLVLQVQDEKSHVGLEAILHKRLHALCDRKVVQRQIIRLRRLSYFLTIQATCAMLADTAMFERSQIKKRSHRMSREIEGTMTATVG